jgi:hypothetical protein
MAITSPMPSYKENVRPSLSSRPLLVSGTPIARLRRTLAAEIPAARRQEKEKPGISLMPGVPSPPCRRP